MASVEDNRRIVIAFVALALSAIVAIFNAPGIFSPFEIMTGFTIFLISLVFGDVVGDALLERLLISIIRGAALLFMTGYLIDHYLIGSVPHSERPMTVWNYLD